MMKRAKKKIWRKMSSRITKCQVVESEVSDFSEEEDNDNFANEIVCLLIFAW